ncbi:hypothetical protein [Methanolobus halotolerans]|uniref:Uncharacterized protein n=1 Tax=Methanolobus halotolerans TaxID=2052935 RepID=A0A4E0R239_9EURY|nr:hypothetical protein [Methanolobus halotolerans]TGC11433.1 hypothetical protein CUN85_00720 [Methanolobus halotolerans]
MNDGPKDIVGIQFALKASRQALLPKIRILQEENIVSVVDGFCQLTVYGRILVEKMVPLLDTFDSLGDIGSYDMAFIPPHLFK